MIEVEKLTEDEAKKRLDDLIDLDYHNDACVTCGLPCLLHKGDTCMRSNSVETEEEYCVLKVYREKMKPIGVWMKRSLAAERKQTGWTKSLEMLIDRELGDKQYGCS